MPKKSFVQNAVYQGSLKMDSSALKFSLNLVGAKKVFKNIFAVTADMFGIILTSSVCLIGK